MQVAPVQAMTQDVVVIKFGGTSVGTVERIQATAQRIARAFAEHRRLVVVVSAMAGQTDRLLDLGRTVARSISPDALREMDALAATGEQVSAALMALALQELGLSARSLSAHQISIATDGRFQRARIRHIDPTPLYPYLDQGVICVVAGFQGTDSSGNLVTLGRGGSDTTAVAIATALNARLCEIYTDVDGVYTADPRLVPAARKLPEISFEEMLEMASAGAKVLMIRSVELAMKNRLVLAVRSSFTDAPGTMIKHMNGSLEDPVVTGLAHDLRQAKITLIGLPSAVDTMAEALRPLADADISIDFITQNVGADGRMTLTFTVEEKLLELAVAALRSGLQNPSGPAPRIDVDKGLAKVSAIGIGMRTHAGVAYRFFSCLTRNGVAIHMALSTEIKVSCLVAADDCNRALEILHREFLEQNGAHPPLVPTASTASA